jgi:hypothetical protein
VPIFSADEIPILLRVGGGPAATPRVISAVPGNVGGDAGGDTVERVSGDFPERQADVPNTAAPITADPAAARADLLEIAASPCVPSWSQASFMLIRLGRLPH